MNTRLLASLIILAGAALAFVTVGFLPLPMSTTRTVSTTLTVATTGTVTQEATNTVTYFETYSYPYTTWLVGLEPSCYGIYESPGYPCNYFTATAYSSYTSASYYVQTNTYTLFSSSTSVSSSTGLSSSTSIIPVSEQLGLGGGFWVVAALVIAALTLLTVWTARKPNPKHTRTTRR